MVGSSSRVICIFLLLNQIIIFGFECGLVQGPMLSQFSCPRINRKWVYFTLEEKYNVRNDEKFVISIVMTEMRWEIVHGMK